MPLSELPPDDTVRAVLVTVVMPPSSKKLPLRFMVLPEIVPDSSPPEEVAEMTLPLCVMFHTCVSTIPASPQFATPVTRSDHLQVALGGSPPFGMPVPGQPVMIVAVVANNAIKEFRPFKVFLSGSFEPS